MFNSNKSLKLTDQWIRPTYSILFVFFEICTFFIVTELIFKRCENFFGKLTRVLERMITRTLLAIILKFWKEYRYTKVVLIINIVVFLGKLLWLWHSTRVPRLSRFCQVSSFCISCSLWPPRILFSSPGLVFFPRFFSSS